MRGRLAGLALVLVMSCVVSGRARAQESLEYPVKAAFLLNFMRYVEWPEATRGHLVVCVAAPDPFGPILDRTLEGKEIAGRRVVVRRLGSGDEALACAVVFVPAAAMPRWTLLSARLAERPALTVGDARGFATQGGMIGFFAESNHLRFEVNREASERAGLRLSSRLLGLARSVRDGRAAAGGPR